MSDLRSGGFSEYLSSSNDVIAGLANLPQRAAEGSRSLTGIPGESRRPTHLLLYPTLDQSRFVEIAHEDILGTQSLNPEESPFGAAGGVRVILRQNATIAKGLVAAPDGEAGDEFDLDIRLGMAESGEKRMDDAGDTDDCEETDDEDCEGTIDCQTDVGCPPRTARDDDTCFTCNVCPETKVTCGTCGQQRTCEKTCETCETCVTCGAECRRPTVGGCETVTCLDECGRTGATCPPQCHPR